MWIYVILLKYFPDDKNEILMAICDRLTVF